MFTRQRNAKQVVYAHKAVVIQRRETEEEMKTVVNHTSYCEFLPVHILSNKSLWSERGENGSACCAMRVEG